MASSRGSALLLGLLLVATTAVPAVAAPTAAAPASDDQVWIVTLDEDHPSTLHAEALVRRHGGTLRQVYASALNGFSFSGPEQAARNLERSLRVARVEADQPLRATDHLTPTSVQRIGAPTAHTSGSTGSGVNIAILGTGSPITVANMSLSGPGSAGDTCDASALRRAICNSVDAGVVHVVATGNDGWDVANSIPAAYPEAITVAALMLAANPALTAGEVNELLQSTGECPDGAPSTASSGPCSGQGQWFTDPDGITEPLINAPRAATAAGSAPPPSDPDPAPEPEPEPEPDPEPAIDLSITAYKVRGVHHADLSWSGTTAKVDILRDEGWIATVEDAVSYADNIGAKGGGTYTYQVCETDTGVCSAPVTATF